MPSAARCVNIHSRQLDCPTEDRLHTVSQFEQVRVGRRRELWQREIQQFVRAHRGNVDRYVSIYEGDLGCDVTRVRIDPLDNCRLGRVRSDPASALLAAELVFDRPLALGETQPFRYRITDGTGGECTEYVRGFRYPVSHYLLQVSFAPPALRSAATGSPGSPGAPPAHPAAGWCRSRSTATTAPTWRNRNPGRASWASAGSGTERWRRGSSFGGTPKAGAAERRHSLQFAVDAPSNCPWVGLVRSEYAYAMTTDRRSPKFDATGGGLFGPHSTGAIAVERAAWPLAVVRGVAHAEPARPPVGPYLEPALAAWVLVPSRSCRGGVWGPGAGRGGDRFAGPEGLSVQGAPEGFDGFSK